MSNKIKTFISVLFLLIFFHANNFAFGIIDSLETKLDSVDGVERIKLLNKLSGAYWGTSTSQSLKYAKEALVEAENLSYKTGMFAALTNIGNILWLKAEYDSAITVYKQSLKLAEELGDSRPLAVASYNIAMLNNEIGNYAEALKYFLKSLEYYTEANDLDGVAESQNGIGSVYWNLNNFEKALFYFKKSLAQKEKLNDSSGVVIALNNIGLIYRDLGQYDKALRNYERALKIKLKLGNLYSIETSYNNIGELFIEREKAKEAIPYLNKALKLAKEIDDKNGIVTSSGNLGKAYLLLKDYSKAENYLNKAFNLAQQIGSKKLIGDTYEYFISFYKELGNYKKALEYSEKFTEVKEQLFSSEFNKKVAELQVKYETAQKENEINKLKNAKRIQNYELNKERNFRNFLLISSVLFILFGLAIFYAYKVKTDANEKLKWLNSTKDVFFSIISHDLKNPFHSIIAFSNMMIKDFDLLSDEEKILSLKEINKAARSSNELLDNLLSWSMSQRGMIPLIPQKINLRQLINKTLEILEPSAKRKNIIVENNVSADLNVYADQNTISTVIRNLLTNSVKFTREGGEVVISAKRYNNQVEVDISDSGIGIRQEELDNLFRIDTIQTSYGTAKEKGTGIGLILCKEFIDKNGGKIWAESEVGKGSHFKFILPSA